MRNKILIFESLYVSTMILISLFYVFANFDKAISKQLGFAQLIFSILPIIILIVGWSKNMGLPSFIYILYSLAQLVAVFNWIIYFSVTFHIFSGVVTINWLGLTIHLFLIVWGLSMIILKKSSKQGKGFKVMIEK